MADDSRHEPIPESDDGQLARCRQLQGELRELIALSRATIARSHELIAIKRATQFPRLLAAAPAAREELGL